MSVSREELLISVLADRLADERHVAVGAASPIPGAAALLAKAERRERKDPRRMDVTILHSQRHNRFTDGGRELFDASAQGRVGAFFLGGVQIDGEANINLIGVGGEYPTVKRRFPGSFGSALMYYMVPNVILFREEHSPRTLVETVEFISAPGSSEPGVFRPGGPRALVTGRCVFEFDRDAKRFTLKTFHDGESVESIRAATGFDFDVAPDVGETPLPSAERLERMRAEVAPQVAEFYPEFATRVFGVAA